MAKSIAGPACPSLTCFHAGEPIDTKVVGLMTRYARTALTAAIMAALLTASAAGALCAQVVNMLEVNTPREQTAVSDASLQSLVPPGYAITDKIALQLDGVGPRELAVVMCAENRSHSQADWWLRYSGPSKVVIINEADASLTPLAEFHLKGSAPAATASIAAPFFTDDLDGDGLPELFVRTQEYAGGSSGWTHASVIKWHRGAFKRAGIFGVAEHGGMYFLDNWVKTPGREVVLLHQIAGDHAHLAPRRYRAQTYGWSNGYYVVLGEIDTNEKYDNPDTAFTNLLRYVWSKGVYRRLPRGY